MEEIKKLLSIHGVEKLKQLLEKAASENQLNWGEWIEILEKRVQEEMSFDIQDVDDKFLNIANYFAQAKTRSEQMEKIEEVVSDLETMYEENGERLFFVPED
jgi:hypothetical protein